VFVFMSTGYIDTKKWVGEDPRDGGVTEVGVDDKDREDAEKEVVA